MSTWIWIAVLGAAGAASRYGLSLAVGYTGGLAWSTLLANVSGSFLIGLLFTIGEEHRPTPDWLMGLMVGYVGGFTTFSTFSLETLSLLERKLYATAAFYVALSVLLSLAAVAIGASLGRLAR